MFYLIRRYLDEGSNAGDGDNTAAADNKNSAVGAGAGDGDNKAAADKGADGSNDKKADAQNTDKKDSKNVQMSDDHKKAIEENENLKKQVGRLGTDLESFGTLKKMFESDPADALKKMAKEFGVKLNIAGDKKPVITDDEGNVSAEKLEAKFEEFGNNLLAKFNAMIAPKLETLEESAFAQKYDDWHDLAGERKSLRLASVAGRVDNEELLHLAAKGRNIALALEAAKQLGRQEYLDELNKKTGGDLSGGKDNAGANTKTGDNKGGLDIRKSQVDFNRVMGRLRKPKIKVS